MERVAAAVAMPQPACPTCGGRRAKVVLEDPVDYEYAVVPSRAYRFLLCDECDSEFLDPRPTEAELLTFYPSGYHAYNDDHGAVAHVLVALRARVRGRAYRSLLGSPTGRVFDVGAGDCRHFIELGRVAAGLAFAGVEINPEMAARARERGYDVETGTLERIDLRRHQGRYDIVSMNHVLEHVHDPAEVLGRAFALLRPGGHVVGQLPTASSWEHSVFGGCWAGYHFPRHLQVFSRRGLCGLLERVGFDRVRLRSTPHVQTAISIQNTLVRLGVVARLRFGRMPLFGALVLAAAPAELLAATVGRSGVIDFEARRP
jgi:SAM-dependent methyltransferase